MRTIDLNADLGEGFATDAELIPLLTSANIACGGHAGDESTMTAAVRQAVESGVAIGAHPGHEDREHFGRRELPITPRELIELLNRQADRLHAIADGLGGRVGYVKLHGKLYHQVGRDAALAEAAIDFVLSYHAPIGLLCMHESALWRIADDADVAYSEAFPDRLYLADGSLAPRSQTGSVLESPTEIAAQAVQLAEHADSLCLHGDHPTAIKNAIAVRAALNEAGYKLRAFSN